MKRAGTLALCGFGLACTHAPALRLEAPLGSRENPVRAYTYLGEREYLSRLRCIDGTTPHVQRLLGRENGPYGHPLIAYRVRCIYLNEEAVVHIDELHPDYVELRPVPGFTLGAEPDPRQLFWLER
jgi:hypothetical protein